jgi:hypothetical protein
MVSRPTPQLVVFFVLATGTILHSFPVFPSMTVRLKTPTVSGPFGFTVVDLRQSFGERTISFLARSLCQSENDVCVNDLLSDLPTPTLLIELSLAESAMNKSPRSQPPSSLDAYLQNGSSNFDLLDGTLFVHTRVTDTSLRDQISREMGSGKSLVIAQVDATPQFIPGGAYLGIGLANHHVGGYYWARGMGMGASLAAHGIGFGASSGIGTATVSHLTNGKLQIHHATQDERLDVTEVGDRTEGSPGVGGEIYWKKRDPGQNAKETTEESSNSNDGKRSEWADFLTIGDTVQLVPYNTSRVLTDSPFQRMIGVRRLGRPLGADPIVERIWERALVVVEGADCHIKESRWVSR